MFMSSTKKKKTKILKEELSEKDLKRLKRMIRDEVGDILRDIWLKRGSWK